MPNHVVNEVIFRNVSREVQENILKKVLKDGHIDFSVLLPPPLNIWQGGLGEKEKQAFGKKNWHDWNTKNWGTKWNAYGGYDEDDKEGRKNIIQTDDSLTLVFQTAWGPPRLWLCALFNATGISFEHNWFDEGGRDAYYAKFFFPEDVEDSSPEWKEESREDKEFIRRMRILLYGRDPDEE